METVSDVAVKQEEAQDGKVAQLLAREKELSILIVQGSRSDLERDAGILKELGEIHEELGILSKRVQHFVWASGLYNAALLRTKVDGFVKEIQQLIRRNEISLCKVLSVKTDKLPSDFRSEFKDKLSQIRKNTTEEANNLLDQLEQKYDLDLPTTERILVEKDLTADIQKLFDNMCEDLVALIQRMISLSKEILGEPPQEYAALALGSLARGDTTPFSDLEWCILVEDETKDVEYFRNLTRMVHMFVLNIGETLLKSLNIKSLNDYDTPGGHWFIDTVAPRGFQFDSAAPYACNTPIGRPARADKPARELIRTPQHMALLCEEKTALEEGNNIDRIMGTTVKLDGSENADGLVDDFVAARAKYKGERNMRAKALKEIQELIHQFEPKLSFHKNTRTVHDIKQDMYRLPTLVITLFKTVSSLQSDNSWDIVDEMHLKGKLSEDGAHNLKFVVSVVTLLRLLTYSNKSHQNELISILNPRRPPTHDRPETMPATNFRNVKPLVFRYYFTMQPLCKYFGNLDVDTALSEECIPVSFYEDNEYYVASIELQCMSYEKARDKFISCIENSWHIKPENHNATSTRKMGYKGRDVFFDNEDCFVLSCLNGIWKAYQSEGFLRQALEYCGVILDMSRAINHGDHQEIAISLNNFGMTYYDIGDFDQALRYYHDCRQMVTRLGDDSQKWLLAIVLSNIGSTLVGKSEFDGGIENFTKAYSVMECVHEDKNHRDVAACLNNIASAYREKGEFKKALEYFKESYKMFESLHSNNDHPAIVSTLFNIGLVYNETGPVDVCLKYVTEALEMMTRIQGGQDHPSIARFLTSISGNLAKLGRLDEALYHANEALNMMRRMISDADHVITFSCLHAIGTIYQRKGRLDDAIKYEKESVEMARRIQGDSSMLAVDALIGIGGAYELKGQLTLAVTCYEDALEMVKRVISGRGEHPWIAVCLNNIGLVYSKLGNYELALRYGFESLEMTKNIYKTDDHRGVAASMGNIGSVFREIGETELAMQYCSIALEITRKLSSGKNNPDIADTLVNVGCVLLEKGECTSAMEYFTEAQRIMRWFYGSNGHPHLGACLNNIAGAIYKEDSDLALEYYDESLSIARKFMAAGDHTSIESSLHNIAKVHHFKGNLELALKYCLESMEMAKRLYEDTSHPFLADRLEDVASLHQEMGEFILADRFFQEALLRNKQIYTDDNNHAVAKTLDKLGELSVDAGNVELAEKYFKQSFEIRKKLYIDADHKTVAASLKNMGEVCLLKGDTTEAFNYYLESLEMARRLCNDSDDLDVVQALTSIGEAFGKIGDCDSAIEYHSQSLQMERRVRANKDHRSIASTLDKIAMLSFRLGNYDNALQHFQQSLEIKERLYSTNDCGSIAGTLNNIGTIYALKKEAEKALDVYSKALDINTRLHGDCDHDDVVQSLKKVGGMNLYSRKPGEALICYSKATEMKKRLLKGRDDPEIVSLLNNTGNICKMITLFDLASEKFTESLAMSRRLHNGEDDEDSVYVLKCSGSNYVAQGDLDQAIKEYEKAIQIMIKLRGTAKHPDIEKLRDEIRELCTKRGDSSCSHLV